MSIFYKAQAIADLLGVAAPQVRQMANDGKLMTKMEDGQSLVSADSLLDLAMGNNDMSGMLMKALPAFIKGQGVGTGSSFPLSAIAGLLGGNNNGITDMIAKGALSAVTDGGEQKVTGGSLMNLIGNDSKYGGLAGMLGSFALQQLGFKKAGRFGLGSVASLLSIGVPALKKLMGDGFLSGNDDHVDADSLARLVNSDEKYKGLRSKLGDFAFGELGFTEGVDIDLPGVDADFEVEGTVEDAREHVIERTEKRVEYEAPRVEAAKEKVGTTVERTTQHVEPQKAGGGLPGWLIPLLGLLALAVLAIFAIRGCSGGDDGGGAGEVSTGGLDLSEDDCANEEVFCIGLVTDTGAIDDKSFNQSAWEGVQEAASNYDDVLIKFIETTNPNDYGTNIDQFGEKAYDSIVTVGFALGDATSEAGVLYPDIDFIGVDQFHEGISNVVGLQFPEDQAGYLAGVLAASLSESGTIASVLGAEIPPVVRFAEGFENGAASVNADIDVITTYYNGTFDNAFNDPEWGAATAKQAIGNGADIIFGAGGNTGNGALSEVATNEGVYCIGVDSDQWFTVPDAHPCLVTSAMKLIDAGVAELLMMSHDGELPGGETFLGETGLAPFHDFEDVVPDDVKTLLTDLDQQLSDGTLSTGVE